MLGLCSRRGGRSLLVASAGVGSSRRGAVRCRREVVMGAGDGWSDGRSEVKVFTELLTGV